MSDEVLRAIDECSDDYTRHVLLHSSIREEVFRATDAALARVERVRMKLLDEWRTEVMTARHEGRYDTADAIGQWIEWFEGGVHRFPQRGLVPTLPGSP